MKYNVLGHTGVRVSRIGVGTAVFGVAPLEDDVDSLVHRAIELGINFFDTANSYGNQTRFDRPNAPAAAARKSAEELLGTSLKGHRHEVVIATKVMEEMGPGPNDGGFVGGGLSRKHIMLQVEQSLRRLQTDYIDVYYAHHADVLTPMSDTLRAFDDLIRQGKVRYCALSNYPAWALVKAAWECERYNLYSPVATEVRYNLQNREVENELMPACQTLGMTMNVYSPLAGGLFTGRSAFERDWIGGTRWGQQRATKPFNEEQIRLGEQLDDISRESGVKASHLALGWLLAKPEVSSAIVGPETIAELEENAEGGALQLDEDLLAKVDSVGRPETPAYSPLHFVRPVF